MSDTKMKGVLSPVVTPFDRDLKPDAKRLINHCKWLLSNDVGLAVFGTNSEANSLSLAEKIHLLEATRRSRHSGRPHDARHRLLRARRVRRADQTRRRAWLRWHADAAAVLLQRRQRRRPLSQFFRNHPARRRRSPAHLPLSHPARGPGPDHAQPDRAPAQGIPRHHCRRQGQLRRLVEHQGDARSVPARRLRCVPRVGELPAGSAARRWCRLHQRDGQRQSGTDRQTRRELAERRCRRAAGRPQRDAQHLPDLRHDPGAQGRRRALRPRRRVEPLAPAAGRTDRGRAEEVDRRLDASGFTMPGLEAAHA